MVASTNPYTSQIGLDVLRDGGNAVDAVIAMASTHIVVDPAVGHLGGDTFMLVHSADNGTTTALNGSGAAPLEASPQFFREIGGIPAKGPLAASVPGTVSCWAEAHRLFGTQPFSDLLGFGAKLARDGFVVSNRLAHHFQRAAPIYQRFPGSRAQYLAQDGAPPKAGDVLKQPWLSETLTTIGREGRTVFYEGAIAQAMVDYWRREGGLFTMEDFRRHRTRVEEPMRGSFRGFDVLQQPPPSQGVVHLLMLAIFEAALGDATDTNDPETIHVMIEAAKLAFEVRNGSLGDPDFVEPGLDRYTDPAFVASLAERIDPDRAMPYPRQASIVSSDTDYMCVIDKDRNVVSYIHSLFPGCGVTVPEVGALFNSRMLSFSLDESHPNVVAGGKRPLHTLNSWMLMRDACPLAVGGITAGDLQVQFNLQIVSHLVAGELALHEAFDAPRWGHRTAEAVQLEVRDPSVAEALRAKGHKIDPLDPWGATGRGHAIAIDHERGILIGHAESRDDGSWTLGY
jgi:gamma-glutamyltranspeptidase/glutathione hydrolase